MAYVPSPHTLQDSDPASPPDTGGDGIAPMEQFLHVDAPVPSWYCPATQAMHANCRTADWYLPAAQDVHTVLAATAVYVPEEQLVQLTRPERAWGRGGDT